MPSWLTFNSETRTFSGTPASDSQGSYTIKVSTTDGHGGTAATTFTFTVPNASPTVIKSLPDQPTCYVGEQFDFDFPENSFSDPDGDSLVYTASQASGQKLPGWIYFNPSLRSFTGVPGASNQGDYSIKVTANDQKGGHVSQNFTLTVPNRGITVGSIPDYGVRVGIPFQYVLPSDVLFSVDGSTLTYSATLADGSKLPSWISFKNRLFWGTPTDIATLNIRVTAIDASGGSASTTFKIQISNIDTNKTAPQVSETIPDQNVTIGNPWTFVFPENTFSNPGYELNYTAKSSNDELIPSWLQFSSQWRNFSGTPGPADHVNKYKIILAAKNRFQEAAQASFNLQFINRPPVALNKTITKNLLINQAYAFALLFKDEDGDPLTCSVEKKPDFMDLDENQCRVTFNPTAKDYEYNGDLKVVADDGFGGKATMILSLSVDYSGYDNFIRWVNFLLPILSAVGGALAAYQKRALLWNLLACWSRPRETVWDFNTSFKILEHDVPGWVGRNKYITYVDPLIPAIGCKAKCKYFVLRRLFCDLCRKKLPEEIINNPNKEAIRKKMLKEQVKEVRAVIYKKPISKIDSLLNSCTFLDFILKRPCQMQPIKVKWNDCSLNIGDLANQNIWNLTRDEDQMKLFVWGYDGRLLEKIRCEFTTQAEESSAGLSRTMRESPGVHNVSSPSFFESRMLMVDKKTPRNNDISITPSNIEMVRVLGHINEPNKTAKGEIDEEDLGE